ncbi:hypothetical protein P9597_01860 [Aneurinibacillus migulanus]|uniref:hypothetical protein n=1 Tax=Aneurinibacillus migulanus TaxID=47500 RepID=UPI002E1FADEC|nr:hypothetical protein [Aneurinibacillus migulanus]
MALKICEMLGAEVPDKEKVQYCLGDQLKEATSESSVSNIEIIGLIYEGIGIIEKNKKI